MAVAEMGKLNLVAMSYDRDAVLNALQQTGATEVKLHNEAENTVALSSDCDELRAYLASVESALSYLAAETEVYNKDHKIRSDILKDGFEVSYSEFMSAGKNRDEIDAAVKKINGISDRIKQCNAELAKIRRTVATAQIYSVVREPLNGFRDTQHAKVRLGTIPAAAKDSFFATVREDELSEGAVLFSDADSALILAAAHKASERFDGILQNAGFTPCPFDDARSGEEIFLSLKERERDLVAEIQACGDELYSLHPLIHPLKIYSDYLGFELEKAELSDKLRATQTTFLLEAYVPKTAEETVKTALDGVSCAVWYEFSEPSADEIPPTLYQNNAVVKNFETITNMYSPVNAREFDPNTVMAFFYSLFLGFIMGDIGYGLLMIVGGGFIYLKNIERDSGLKRLAGVFAIGGIFAVLWGFLFNSLFGIQMPFLPTVLPDAQSDMWSILGIRIPGVLVISLEIGVVQLMVGYVCKAWQCWRRGEILDGILDGMVWALFSVGVGLAIVGLVDEANVPSLATVGGITAGACLVVAMLTAGRKEKILGKFTKGFGAAYGIINYASDVLSYARLYGLMLSGAVIAQIVSQYSVQFITGGNPVFVVLGIVLMLVGHVFNLAIGLLGAYIHDARLQYVEFYGRFYEGEGELFAPLGSGHKYIHLSLETSKQ